MSQNWNPELYDNAHSFVSKYGAGIFSWLNPQPQETILDLGCGTGDLAQKILAANANVIGVDASMEMVKKAKAKFSNIEFQQMDARYLTFDNSFDAIFSNAVLHWIPEKNKVIKGMHAALKKGGRIVLEFGGKNNIQQIWSGLKKVLIKRGYAKNADISFWYYPSIAEYATELEKQGFRVTRAAHFDRPTSLQGEQGLKDWFLMFMDNFFVGVPALEKEAILDEIEANLRATHYVNGTWYADYKRIQILALKE